MKKILSAIGIIILIITIALTGCNEQKNPNIIKFTIVPNEIKLGENASIRWQVINASSVSIDQGIGAVNLSGNLTITPTETTTYTLTAKASTTVTATSTIIVHQITEKNNISMSQRDFYIEIKQINNTHINQSQVQVITINKNSLENQTNILRPIITEGNGNNNLGIGDIISFQNLSDFSVGEVWEIQLLYNGKIISECEFVNPKGPYDTPLVRMIQSENNITIIGIINGPINQTSISINTVNTTSNENQTMVLGAMLIDKDNNPLLLGISDGITFSNLNQFKTGDTWIINLIYNGTIISQCKFINPLELHQIPV